MFQSHVPKDGGGREMLQRNGFSAVPAVCLCEARTFAQPYWRRNEQGILPFPEGEMPYTALRLRKDIQQSFEQGAANREGFSSAYTCHLPKETIPRRNERGRIQHLEPNVQRGRTTAEKGQLCIHASSDQFRFVKLYISFRLFPV